MLDSQTPESTSGQPVAPTPFSLVQVTLTKQEYIDLKWQANHYQEMFERTRKLLMLELWLQQTVTVIWHKWLGRRSRKSYIPWEKFFQFLKRFPLTPPRIQHQYYRGHQLVNQ